MRARDIDAHAVEALLADPLCDVALTRILVTHYHPDHIGLAGWLCERFGLPLLMSQTEYLVSLAIHLDPGALNSEPYRSFYRSHGLDADHTERLLTNLLPKEDGAGIVPTIVTALSAVLLSHGRHQACVHRAAFSELHPVGERHGRVVPGRVAHIIVACFLGERRDSREQGVGVLRRESGDAVAVESEEACEESVEPCALLRRERRAFRQ